VKRTERSRHSISTQGVNITISILISNFEIFLKDKMPKALILVADGSEEIEFVTPYDGMFPSFAISSPAVDEHKGEGNEGMYMRPHFNC
jgi:hypothetical protein